MRGVPQPTSKPRVHHQDKRAGAPEGGGLRMSTWWPGTRPEPGQGREEGPGAGTGRGGEGGVPGLGAAEFQVGVAQLNGSP